MKYCKIFILLIFIIILSGCKNKKKVCTFDKEEKDIQTHISITLYSNEDIVEKEEIKSEYIFKTKEDADNSYKILEESIEKDESLKIEQNDEVITVYGEKDVTEMKYDKESKIDYYEQLGYTCK